MRKNISHFQLDKTNLKLIAHAIKNSAQQKTRGIQSFMTQRLMLRRTATWNDMWFLRSRIVCNAENSTPGETFCGCGRMLQGLTNEVQNQAEQRVSSRFIMHVPVIHGLALKNTPKGPTPTMWRSKYTAIGYEAPHSDEGCFAATATIQCIRALLARCLDKRDQGHEAFVADCTQAFLNAEVCEGEQLYAQPLEGWNPKILTDGRRVVWRECVRPCWVSEHFRDAGKNIYLAS